MYGNHRPRQYEISAQDLISLLTYCEARLEELEDKYSRWQSKDIAKEIDFLADKILALREELRHRLEYIN